MHDTLPYLRPTDFPAIRRKAVEVLQVNLGYLCNLSCTHCHVNAGPRRTELMTSATIDRVLDFLAGEGIHTLDLTGGAPEMNPDFKRLVTNARNLGVAVIDRCNLVILEEPGYADLAGFLAEQRVDVVASLPCYLEDNVDRQRGRGTFQASIAALRKLNALGYGRADSGLRLDLVFNPQGATLPPDQSALERAYRQHLSDEFGVVFNHLLAMANLPIQRFGSQLISKGGFDEYLQLLKDNHRPQNLPGVMCRNTVSVDWQGYLYDCDFNQMLKLPLLATNGQKLHLGELSLSALPGTAIQVGSHCYGCTAGQGSSCGGSLTTAG